MMVSCRQTTIDEAGERDTWLDYTDEVMTLPELNRIIKALAPTSRGNDWAENEFTDPLTGVTTIERIFWR